MPKCDVSLMTLAASQRLLKAQPLPQKTDGVASRLLEDGVLGEPLPVGVVSELVRAAGDTQQAGRMRPAEERDGPAWESPSP